MEHNSLQLAVRPARSEDRSSILAFCQETFSWGDYIADVWDEWLADIGGQLLVGLIADQPVAVMHIEILAGGVAWFEGMRVHPDWRSRGIGQTLTARACDYARARQARVARLVTNSRNSAAHKTLAAQGLVRTAVFNQWSADSMSIESVGIRLAAMQDIPWIETLWVKATGRPADQSLVPDPHWRWTELTGTRLRDLVSRQQIWLAHDAIAVLETADGEDDRNPVLHALAGDRAGLRAMALHARVQAGKRAGGRVEATLVSEELVDAVLNESGDQVEGAMLVYERTL
jgi:GNAT superfamily N-acetyltransferase